MASKLKIVSENKVVFSTPHATVVIKNGLVDFMKVCRPTYKETTGKCEQHDERDIEFKSWSEYCQLADELREVTFAVDQELNK